MNDLCIYSYNCRGLRAQRKRTDIFDFFKEKKVDILCLQETHFTQEMEKTIYTEWNGNCFFSHGKSNAKGVALSYRDKGHK